MATPSSKQNFGATPTHPTSSPHPSSVPMARPLSHKSPSIRTPSASGHGHGHQLSTSSHQYATPLAANGTLDDAAAFSSPSALLALGSYTGISPSPAVQDGLVGAGMNENDIHVLGMHSLGLGGLRDNDEERKRHIEEVVRLLRSRIAGRGVCREAVERLAQLEEFDSVWQENNLSIAGNFVDLEIEFWPEQDIVKDVSLKYTTPEVQDGVRREEAAAVLKRDLIQSPLDQQQGIWNRLDGFHANLERLAKMDKLSQEVNCFEALEGLYDSLKRVWEEEARRRSYGGLYEHLCKGWVGRPGLHKGRRVGLGLGYWVEQHRVLDAKLAQSLPDAISLERPVHGGLEEGQEDHSRMRSVIIECEAGYPSLRISKKWVGPEVLTAVHATGSSTLNGPVEPELMLVNWVDPPPTLVSGIHVNQQEPITVNSGMVGPVSPNRRFIAKLDPPIDIPILAASEIYRHLGLQLPQEFKITTYDGLLVPGWMASSQSGNSAPEGLQHASRRKRRKSVVFFDPNGCSVKRHHSYTFQTFEAVAGRTLRDLPFSHPRQLADVLPVLRQYGLLASLICKIFPPRSNNNEAKAVEEPANPPKPSQPRNSSSFRSYHRSDDHLTVLSNEDPNEKLLDLLLGHSVDNGPTERISNTFSKENNHVKIDITLRTQMGQPPLIMLLFAIVDEDLNASTSPFVLQREARKVSIHFEIGLNGRITFTHVAGLGGDESHGHEARKTGSMASMSTRTALEFQDKLVLVLETSEDIGILVEWVLQRLQETNG